MFIVCYDPETNMPLFTAEQNKNVTLEFFESTGATCFLSEIGDIHGKYVENETLMDIQDIEINSNFSCSVSEELVISEIPNPTTVFVDGSEIGIVTDGTLEFQSSEPGIYQVRLVSKPKYHEKTIEIEVS
jgi:hypothetical protein